MSNPEFISAKKISRVSIYDTTDNVWNRPYRFSVAFTDAEGKRQTFHSPTQPLVSLQYPDDTDEGYRQLGLLFEQADLRNIKRDRLFMGVEGANVCARKYVMNPREGFKPRREKYFAGIKVRLPELYKQLQVEIDTRLGFYDTTDDEVEVA